MKKIFYISRTSIFMLLLLTIAASSCVKDLLNQQPTTEMGAALFWQTESDALSALMGAYSHVRYSFDRDYYFDGQGEYIRVRSTSPDGGPHDNNGFRPSDYGDQLDVMYGHLYGGVNRTNYVIGNVKKMLPNAKSEDQRRNLEAIIGEARLLRGMTYFRLICLWGDVPYFGHIINDDSEVSNLSRTPIADIKDSIMADFTYAYEKLPNRPSIVGRAAKPAALSFRGKMQLYWACWNKFGWPELEGFTPSATEVQTAYQGAAADFKEVIDNPAYGLTLFRNGEPGNWGTMGKADVLPNYYYLFIPTTGNGASEMIMVFTHGGKGTGQSEELMRNFGSRDHESGQQFMNPFYEIADRYQSTITGDFCDPLILLSPSTNPNARTTLNSAVNPESYADRDYRMKGTLLWDYEQVMSMSGLQSTGMLVYLYNSWGASITINGEKYTTYTTSNANGVYGYAFRKLLRNYAGQGRNEGDYNWPVMRLADVYLMYAEACQATNDESNAREYANKVRRRAFNLPVNTASDVDIRSSGTELRDAIREERFLELCGEGVQHWIDVCRWKTLDKEINQWYKKTAVGPPVYAAKSLYFPIPRAELENNMAITQSVGYENQ